MTERIVVLMMSVGLCASMARGDINATGDVKPPDPATWTAPTNPRVGDTGTGSVTVDDGSGVISGSGYIGYQSGSAGDVTVRGVGSLWTVSGSGQLEVGRYGNGRLDITNGGSVSARVGNIAYKSGSTGVVTVSGFGATWTNSSSLSVGGFGNGRLEITNGGSVSDSLGSIGSYSGSTGAVTVSGVGTTWTNSEYLLVGNYSNGALDIANGAAVSSGSCDVGLRSGFTGAVTISGEGATWTNSRFLAIGSYGNGTLDIANGGVVSNSGNGYVGRYSDSTGAVTVSGFGATWTNSKPLSVGSAGNGTLDITNGGVVSSSSCNVALASTAAGVITVSGAGSTLASSSDLSIGRYGAGTLNIYDAGLVSVGDDLTIDNDGGGDSFITMGTGGMLALNGNYAASLPIFLGEIIGTDDIRYWEDSIWDWADITGATPGEDYTLDYHTTGDLSGYTVLTVTTVPEPATLILMAAGFPFLLKRKRKSRCTSGPPIGGLAMPRWRGRGAMMCRFSVALCLLGGLCNQTAGENLTAFPVSVRDGDRAATGVGGGVIVWQDNRNGNWDVYAKDLGTGLEWAVCDNPANQWLPAVSGNLIVWTDQRNGDSAIYGRYLDGGDEFLVSGPGASVRFGPSVSGTKVVWADKRGPLSQIYYRDLSGGGELLVAPSAWGQGDPDIDGDLVVWTEYGSKRWVYGKDLSSGADLVISESNAYNSSNPHVSGRTVIWLDGRHGGGTHIYMRDAFGGDETRLTSGMSKSMGDISGSLVFWTDYIGGYRIWGTDLATGTEYFIPGLATERDVGAVLDGDLIVWTRITDHLGDVYGAYVPEPATLALLALGGLAVLRRRRK